MRYDKRGRLLCRDSGTSNYNPCREEPPPPPDRNARIGGGFTGYPSAVTGYTHTVTTTAPKRGEAEGTSECENCGQTLYLVNGHIFPPHPSPCRRRPLIEADFLICGIDEVGRGALAGPLIAVAALFRSQKNADWRREKSPIPEVNDSKKIPTHSKRVEIYKRILRSPELVDFGLGEVATEEIDEKGIEEANRIAFYRAWSDLRQEPHWMLVDGDTPCGTWPYSQQDFRPKGDGYWWPVGAASILAKVIRDNYMIELGLDYPLYRFARNAGYGTKEHQEVLCKLGPSPYHRSRFVKDIIGRQEWPDGSKKNRESTRNC